MYKLLSNSFVMRLSDGAQIPPDPANTDYAAFLQWVAAGNVPEPADPPNPAEGILAQIAALEVQVTPRRIREALLSGDYSFIQGVDAQIAALRAQLAG